MTTRYYYDGDAPIKPGIAVTLDSEESRHLLKVMRARPGDPLVLFGDGTEFSAKLVETAAGKAVVMPGAELPPIPQTSFHITCGLPWIKGGKTEMAVQKLTELGVSRMIIFHAIRQVARGDADKIVRLRRVAVESCKQCERSYVPVIQAASNLADAVSQCSDVPPQARLLLHERTGGQLLSEAAKPHITANAKVLLLSGPEGGWDENEVDALGNQVRFVSLGPRVLRAETAPIAATAALLALAGDM